MPGPLDSLFELPLVLRTTARYPFWNDLSLLGHETDKSFIVLIIYVDFLVITKATSPFLLDELILFCHGLLFSLIRDVGLIDRSKAGILLS